MKNKSRDTRDIDVTASSVVENVRQFHILKYLFVEK